MIFNKFLSLFLLGSSVSEPDSDFDLRNIKPDSDILSSVFVRVVCLSENFLHDGDLIRAKTPSLPFLLQFLICYQRPGVAG